MLKKIPFNLFLLDPSKQRLAGMLPVESMDIYALGGAFHSQGLYSVEIFGSPGSKNRQTRRSFIDMRTNVMHPKIYQVLAKVKGLYKGILEGKMYAIWDDKLKDFVKSDIIDGETGYNVFMNHFHDILYTSNDSDIREVRIKLLQKTHDVCMYRYMPIIPAGLREIEIKDGGRITEDDVNLLYKKVIRIRNTISIFAHNTDDASYNAVRTSLQAVVNEIYDYIESILKGKKGFLLSKWASRNIHNGTRNVITAMDASPVVLGSDEAIDASQTVVGLHQYLKGTADLSVYNIKNGPMSNLILNLPNPIYVVDKITFKRKQITPSQYVRESWGTEAGIEELINKFEKLDIRDKPIKIDNDYAALIYRDEHSFRVFYNIDDLPTHFSKSKVKPITWVEMFYISVYKQSKKVAGYITRYPIIGTGSIYPCFVYLTTTVKVESLQELDEHWKLINPNEKAISMPIIGEKYMDSLQVHINKIQGLAGDYDGDKTSFNMVTSKEAIQEAKDYLNSKTAYIQPDGTLTYGVNNSVSPLILYSFTRGLIDG